MSKDSIYAEALDVVGDFVFDQNVVNVFDDMIRRSVPGYGAIINMIGCLAEKYVQEKSTCYDLGCSLGAATLAMRRRIPYKNVNLIAVDNSEAMVKKCQTNVVRGAVSPIDVKVLCSDIRQVKVVDASMVVLNFTLQFIPQEERQELLEHIYSGLREGGILVLSEKIAFDDSKTQEMQDELHATFKKLNGYSDLEISQKRTSLENVLVPDTLNMHRTRLKEIGFDQVDAWFQCFNFVSMIAVK